MRIQAAQRVKNELKGVTKYLDVCVEPRDKISESPGASPMIGKVNKVASKNFFVRIT